MRHRILVGCLLLMTTLLILAGCGSGSSNDEAANDEATDVSQEIQTEDTSSRWYTDEELEMLAAAYYESINGERPPISQVDHVDDEEVTIHLYEDMGDHIATWDWYTVNRSTLKGQDNLGNEIDLSSVADR